MHLSWRCLFVWFVLLVAVSFILIFVNPKVLSLNQTIHISAEISSTRFPQSTLKIFETLGWHGSGRNACTTIKKVPTVQKQYCCRHYAVDMHTRQVSCRVEWSRDLAWLDCSCATVVLGLLYHTTESCRSETKSPAFLVSFVFASLEAYGLAPDLGGPCFCRRKFLKQWVLMSSLVFVITVWPGIPLAFHDGFSSQEKISTFIQTLLLFA